MLTTRVLEVKILTVGFYNDKLFNYFLKIDKTAWDELLKLKSTKDFINQIKKASILNKTFHFI